MPNEPPVVGSFSISTDFTWPYTEKYVMICDSVINGDSRETKTLVAGLGPYEFLSNYQKARLSISHLKNQTRVLHKFKLPCIQQRGIVSCNDIDLSKSFVRKTPCPVEDPEEQLPKSNSLC